MYLDKLLQKNRTRVIKTKAIGVFSDIEYNTRIQGTDWMILNSKLEKFNHTSKMKARVTAVMIVQLTTAILDKHIYSLKELPTVEVSSLVTYTDSLILKDYYPFVMFTFSSNWYPIAEYWKSVSSPLHEHEVVDLFKSNSLSELILKYRDYLEYLDTVNKIK